MTTPRIRERASLRPSLFLAVAVGGVLGLLLHPAVGEEAACTASGCHAALLTPPNQHMVLEACDNCHKSDGSPHPAKGKKTFQLVKDEPALCQDCHEKPTKKNIHFPVENATCTTCHNPHSSAQEKLLKAPLKEVCAECHDAVLKVKEPHGPAATGDCTACHDPHQSDLSKLLKKEEPELCFSCHEGMKEEVAKSDVHPALVAGCTSCHQPHGTNFPKLLSADGPEVCYPCHSDIQDAVDKSAVPHAALQIAGCVSCHSPHASDQAKLLLKPQKEVCLECHAEALPKNVKFSHDEGRCGGCHQPHGSANAKLLLAEFPTAPYVPYTDQQFALCFKCHKREMVQYAETSYATNFRNGERNLHYVHVNNPTKARSCLLCHSQHGGNNPVLIADTVPFGQWSLPLRFVKTETGGGCSPGCHKPQYYDRDQPGRKPLNNGAAKSKS